ncbi:GNAT family N-acetyltransferase [Pseudalkalibacillus sp. SCS-8]|uniref:GNAT family N-acetyltransferase n=1 Tax=Pseudalkalibacillus nanhaiensis TaxID=3115291 RepID=UPI0032DA2BC8
MIEIRKLRPEDASEYQRIRVEGLKEFPEAFASSYDEEADRSIEDVSKRLDHKQPYTLFTAGAYYGRELVGIGTFVQHSKRKTKHKGEIFGVYVTPHVQRNGIGFKLMEYLVEESKKVEGLEQIQLTVMTENRSAIRTYEKLGFESYGVDKQSLKVNHYYYDELLMKLFL